MKAATPGRLAASAPRRLRTPEKPRGRQEDGRLKLSPRRLGTNRHDGTLYDCDFNLALQMDGARPAGARNIADVDSLAELRDAQIQTGNHCFGCTAGSGSS